MRRWAVVLSAVTISLGAATTVAGTAANAGGTDPYTVSGGNAPPMTGVVPSRDANGAHGKPGGGGGSPDLIYHGGPVHTMATTVVPIFWGSWGSATDKLNGLATFYNGVGGSAYLNTNTEYSDSSGIVKNALTYGAPIFDPSAAPSRAPSTTAILDEVAKFVPNPDPNTYYPVYIDQPRGHAGYCAWHSYGPASNGQNYVVGFFFNLDGDPGCDPQDNTTGHSEGLAALANVSGHELSEMVTDTHLNAWYDSSGAENADKCAWRFPSSSSLWPTIGGQQWKIQGNWSNYAYDHTQGYTDPTYGFQQGCLDTK